MDNNNQGVNEQGSVSPNLEQIEKWLTEDFGRMASLVNAILQDPDLRKTLARWFEGRMENARNAKKAKESLDSQPELFK